MRWGSLDNFLVQDEFWQDKMGKPVVNRDFLFALLKYGTFDSYNIFCLDSNNLSYVQQLLEAFIPADRHDRLTLSLQAMVAETLESRPVDVMHQGDFSYHMPLLIDFRNRCAGESPFAVSGVTHSLDAAQMQTRFLQVLLARPRPYDTIVCTSRCARRLMEKAFDLLGNAFRAAYGADLGAPPALADIPLAIAEAFDDGIDREASRRDLDIPPDRLVLLSMARFSVRQKMDLAPLLECLQWLDHEGRLPPFTLILAGGGDPGNLALVEHMVAHLGLEAVVRFEPNVSFERKRQLYAAADIFVSLVDNYQETFGLTVVEAMAHGLAVVVSDFNGYRELVADGESGILIPTWASACAEPWETVAGLVDPSMLRFYRAQKVACDMAALGRALERLAKDGALRRDLGDEARARSRAYRWSKVIPLYEELWREQKQKTDHWLGHEGRADANGGAGAASLLAADTGALLSHYPTRVLDLDCVVGLSEHGRWRRGQSVESILYADAATLLDQTWMKALINTLDEAPLPLGNLIEGAKQAFGASHEVAVFHVDWLFKHGFLEVEQAASRAPRESPIVVKLATGG